MKIFFKILLVLMVALSLPRFVLAEEVLLKEKNDEEVAQEEMIDNTIIAKTSVFIRVGENVIYDGDFNIPAEGVKKITDSTGDTHEINSQSALAVLISLDEESDSFAVSDLVYYPAFNAFYVRCITSVEIFCDNWQYVINGNTPWQGIDAVNLSDGDKLAFYFGYPRQVVLEKDNFLLAEDINILTQKYNYTLNTWEVLSGVTVGVVKNNPEDPWNPIVVVEKPVNENGKEVFNINEIGSYKIGIKEDYYFPSNNIEILEALAPAGGGGGGGPSLVSHNILNIPLAVSFLKSFQKEDGSFGEDLYTDWVAIALAKVSNTDILGLKNFLLTDELDSTLLTDYERRAMALLALDISPYDGTEVNYIKKIDDAFDGIQFGDVNLYNDDIFALIILSHTNQDLLQEKFIKSINFILSKQKSDGGFDGPDMTAAGIVALSKFQNISGVSEAILKAKEYLKLKQGNDGGWENSFATSWVLYALKDLNEDVNLWEKNGKNPNDYLFALQQPDGGVEGLDKTNDFRLWATAYAIPGALNFSWHDILKNFSQPVLKNISNTNSNQEIQNNTENNNTENQANNTDNIKEVVRNDLEIKTESIIKKEISDTLITKPNSTEPKPKIALASALKTTPGDTKKEVDKLESEIVNIATENISQVAQVSESHIPKSVYYFVSFLGLVGLLFVGFKFSKK